MQCAVCVCVCMYLRTQFALKERNLKIRNMTWVFDPASHLEFYFYFKLWVWWFLGFLLEAKTIWLKKLHINTSRPPSMAKETVQCLGWPSPSKILTTYSGKRRVGRLELCTQSPCANVLRCTSPNQFLGGFSITSFQLKINWFVDDIL